MKYLIYTRMDYEWKLTLRIKNKERIYELIRDVYKLNERCEVKIIYQDEYMQNIVCSFSNRTTDLDCINERLERKLL